MRISDWSSDVCSSDLQVGHRGILAREGQAFLHELDPDASFGGHSVDGTPDNAKEEQPANTYATRISCGRLSALRPAAAAALSQRKSPEKAICSQPTGEVWARRSSGTAAEAARRCWTAASM